MILYTCPKQAPNIWEWNSRMYDKRKVMPGAKPGQTTILGCQKSCKIMLAEIKT